LIAGDPLQPPEASGRKLRYEWRARLLQQRGEIDEIITYRNHFLPVTEERLRA